MMSHSVSIYPGQLVRVFLLAAALLGARQLQAQPTIVSVSPTNGTTGVSTTTKVIFTFSTAMSTYSQVFFTNSSGSFLPVTSAWSAGDTVLTCTPSPSFPAGTTIYWAVAGFDAGFNQLTGTTTGTFTTSGSSGGGGGGSGTNAFTAFVLSKVYEYDQPSTAAPVADTNAAYLFSASTTLASNRTATSITVTFPGGGVSNLTQNTTAPEDYYMVRFSNDQTGFETAYPQGSYTFNVQASASNQTLAVSLPADMTQPNAPHVTNYTAAQALDPSKDFTVGWDAFTGGAGASNFVFLAISRSGTNVFETGNPVTGKALAGTTRAVTIPANTLMAGGSYDATLGFYHTLIVTNNAVNVSSAFRASVTQFTLATTGGVSGPVSFSSPQLSNGKIAFDVSCAAGQTFTILSSSDVSLPPAQWSVLFTTNSSGTSVHFVDPRPATASAMYYRARNGN